MITIRRLRDIITHATPPRGSVSISDGLSFATAHRDEHGRVPEERLSLYFKQQTLSPPLRKASEELLDLDLPLFANKNYIEGRQPDEITTHVPRGAPWVAVGPKSKSVVCGLHYLEQMAALCPRTDDAKNELGSHTPGCSSPQLVDTHAKSLRLSTDDNFPEMGETHHRESLNRLLERKKHASRKHETSAHWYFEDFRTFKTLRHGSKKMSALR